MSETESKPTRKRRARKPKRYFVVNRHGTVHEVAKAHHEALIARDDYRNATPAEIAAYQNAGRQCFDAPLTSL